MICVACLVVLLSICWWYCRCPGKVSTPSENAPEDEDKDRVGLPEGLPALVTQPILSGVPQLIDDFARVLWVDQVHDDIRPFDGVAIPERDLSVAIPVPAKYPAHPKPPAPKRGDSYKFELFKSGSWGLQKAQRSLRCAEILGCEAKRPPPKCTATDNRAEPIKGIRLPRLNSVVREDTETSGFIALQVKCPPANYKPSPEKVKAAEDRNREFNEKSAIN